MYVYNWLVLLIVYWTFLQAYMCNCLSHSSLMTRISVSDTGYPSSLSVISFTHEHMRAALTAQSVQQPVNGDLGYLLQWGFADAHLYRLTWLTFFSTTDSGPHSIAISIKTVNVFS